MGRDTPTPAEGADSGASSDEGEDGDLPGDDLERLADLDDRLGGHVQGEATGIDADSPASADPPDGLDAILLLRQMAAEERGDDAREDREVPRRIGRFAVVREVGRGGFAVVYEAIDTRLLRRVALKVARPEAVLPRGARKRFVREAELAARLVHPNVVTIHEAGEADGRVYIAEEFCAGGNLGEWLEGHPGPLPPRVAARVVLALAGAVAHSHGFCILHRDVKPANVLLVPGTTGPLADDGSRGRLDVKLADFGLGKLADPEAAPGGASDLTRAGARLGTPAWMAPEQIDRSFGPVGPATDIHALGLLLDRLLTGRCAHAGSDDAETMRLLLTAETVPADRVVRGVPADLGAVTARCLAKRPVDRYATVADLAGDLSRFLDGRPTVARPVTAVGHVVRFAGRHRGLVAASAVAVAATLVASAALWLGNLERQQSARRMAEVRGHQAAATLRRGFESWRTGDVLGALGQLDTCRTLDPQLADSLAGRWLRARLHGEETILIGAGGRTVDLHTLAVAPDGSAVAVGGADGVLRVVRVSHREVTVSGAIVDEINNVVFSPDGRRLACAGQDGRVVIADAGNGLPVASWDTQDGPVFGLAWAPDGETIASGGGSRVIRIHSVAEGGTPLVEGRPFDDPADPVAGSTEVESLVSLGADRLVAACGPRVAILDARSLRVLHRLDGHDGTVGHVDVSPDGRRIVTSGSDRQPRVWDADSGALLRVLATHPSWVAGCRFTPDGTRVVTGCRDGVVRVLPVDGTGPIATHVGHVGRVWDVGVLPDGALVSSGGDGTVRLWNPRRTLEFSGCSVLPPVAGGVTRAEPLGDSSLLVAPRDAATLLQFHRDGASAGRVDLPQAALNLAIDARRGRVAISGLGYRIVTIPLPGMATGAVHRLPDDIRSQVFTWLDKGRLLVGDNTGRLVVWDDGTARAEVIDAFGVNIDALDCTFARPPRAVVCAGKAVWLYDLGADGTPRSGGRRLVDLPVRTGTVRVVAWAPDGASFVIGTNTGEVERFDAVTGLSLGSFARHAREMIALAWSPAGRTLVTADAECVRLSDVRTTTVFDEFRPGWAIESVRLAGHDDGSIDLVVAGNAGPSGQGGGRIAIATLPVP